MQIIRKIPILQCHERKIDEICNAPLCVHGPHFKGIGEKYGPFDLTLMGYVIEKNSQME